MQTKQKKSRLLRNKSARLGMIGALSLPLWSGCSGGSSGGTVGGTVGSTVGGNISGVSAASSAPQVMARSVQTFVNPLVKQEAADPWMLHFSNFYLFTFTSGRDIQIWKSSTLQGLGKARKVTVWRAPASGPTSRDIWAPEIHFLKGKWYIYFSATSGPDGNRRVFVLEAKTADPQGAYYVKSQLAAPLADEYAIDGSVFQQGEALYLLWSGRENKFNTTQNIYIAPMSNPWTISGPRVRLSTPEYAWERHGWGVNEAPEAVQHLGKTFITYSASGGSTPDYCLGLLSNAGGSLLSAAAWKKSPVPVFSSYQGTDGSVYTVGHNSFTTSPDGREDWIVYHGKQSKSGGWEGRLPRAQPFTWAADGTPAFGHPIPAGVKVPVPSG